MPDSWMSFLRVRALLIQEMRAEGQSCTEIADILSMDPGQVFLINFKHEQPDHIPDDARRAVKEVHQRGMAAITQILKNQLHDENCEVCGPQELRIEGHRCRNH